MRGRRSCCAVQPGSWQGFHAAKGIAVRTFFGRKDGLGTTMGVRFQVCVCCAPLSTSLCLCCGRDASFHSAQLPPPQLARQPPLPASHGVNECVRERQREREGGVSALCLSSRFSSRFSSLPPTPSPAYFSRGRGRCVCVGGWGLTRSVD